jgi:peptidoglycan hydrolase CwlO-like protein
MTERLGELLGMSTEKIIEALNKDIERFQKLTDTLMIEVEYSRAKILRLQKQIKILHRRDWP